MKKIGVIGVGSAGIQTLCHFLAYLDENWEVTSIHDPSIDIVGIGESTTPPFISALSYGTDFNLYESLDQLDATIKIGAVYKNWREKSFLNPLIGGAVAIHFDTYGLRDYALPKFESLWGDKFKCIHGNVSELRETDTKVTAIINDNSYDFDYIVDCRGFPKDYTGYTIMDGITVNHALVHNINKPGDWNYTGHRATRNGWMWEIPLKSRQSYGYMFDDTITPIEEAKEDFAKEIGVDVSELNKIEFKFKSYYCNKPFSGRVLKNGNLAVFYEPLFSNSLWLYDRLNRFFFDYIIEENTSPKNIQIVNDRFNEDCKKIHELIAYNYHGGSIYDTPFWQNIKSKTKDIVFNSESFKNTQKLLLENKEKNYWKNATGMVWAFDPYNLYVMDKNFEYNYFT
jgi:hypothetical protein